MGVKKKKWHIPEGDLKAARSHKLPETHLENKLATKRPLISIMREDGDSLHVCKQTLSVHRYDPSLIFYSRTTRLRLHPLLVARQTIANETPLPPNHSPTPTINVLISQKTPIASQVWTSSKWSRCSSICEDIKDKTGGAGGEWFPLSTQVTVRQRNIEEGGEEKIMKRVDKDTNRRFVSTLRGR